MTQVLTSVAQARDWVRRRPTLVWGVGLGVTVLTVVVAARTVDGSALSAAWGAARQHPVAVLGVTLAYSAAFGIRAWAWRRVLPALTYGHALSAMHVSLGANHVLPFRLGEGLRVVSAVRRAGVDPAAAMASTVALRAGDVAALAALVLVTGAGLAAGLGVAGPVALFLVALAIALGGVWALGRLGDRDQIRLPGVAVVTATVGAWLLESAVMWQAAAWAGVDLDLRGAVLVTSVTVAAQLLAVAPGGVGTYEAAGTAALVGLGVDPGTGLAIAITAHAFKTAYSVVSGAVATVVPAPSLLGRFRVPRNRAAAGPGTPTPDGPVVLFLPAYEEASRVGDVVGRTPETVLGREVRCIVIDDGSSDGTAEEAAAAGATVIRHSGNRGLGAAVRTGFGEALAAGAAAIAFCDADGEYAPEELESLVAPILAGEADYVVGSRFAGDIRRMLPHRRFGNRVLTLATRWVTRVPVTDGQSGYRAFSRTAAAQAEIVHDFNYAQVLTVDLLLKGFRYAEVPISYQFRESGHSFVKLGRYLRAVVPGVWRALNRPALEQA